MKNIKTQFFIILKTAFRKIFKEKNDKNIGSFYTYYLKKNSIYLIFFCLYI